MVNIARRQFIANWDLVSPRFSRAEIFSPDTIDNGLHLIDHVFLRQLNVFVADWFPGRKAFVNHNGHRLRGVRSAREQLELQKVNGNAADLSMHVCGKAADLTIKGVSPADVADAAVKAGFCGIGIYPTFTHLDYRTLYTLKPVVFKRL